VISSGERTTVTRGLLERSEVERIHWYPAPRMRTRKGARNPEGVKVPGTLAGRWAEQSHRSPAAPFDGVHPDQQRMPRDKGNGVTSCSVGTRQRGQP
jgi:hypothetical protein